MTQKSLRILSMYFTRAKNFSVAFCDEKCNIQSNRTDGYDRRYRHEDANQTSQVPRRRA